MSLAKPNVIDLVSVNASGDEITLHILMNEPWDEAANGTLGLHAKLKNYVAFAADGQLLSQYPAAVGKRVRIEVRSTHPLRESERRLIASAREHWCEPEGIRLSISGEDRP